MMIGLFPPASPFHFQANIQKGHVDTAMRHVVHSFHGLPEREDDREREREGEEGREREREGEEDRERERGGEREEQQKALSE